MIACLSLMEMAFLLRSLLERGYSAREDGSKKVGSGSTHEFEISAHRT